MLGNLDTASGVVQVLVAIVWFISMWIYYYTITERQILNQQLIRTTKSRILDIVLICINILSLFIIGGFMWLAMMGFVTVMSVIKLIVGEEFMRKGF